MEINNLLKSNKLSIAEFKESLPPFLSIILGVLASILCGFILVNAFRLYSYLISYSRYYFVHYMDYYMILLYIFCNIFLGLILAIAISYGIKRHKYKNKKNLFILIVFCSFLIYFVFSMIFMYIFFRTGYINYEYPDRNGDRNISLKGFLSSTLYEWPFLHYQAPGTSIMDLCIMPLVVHAPEKWQESVFYISPVAVNIVLLFIQFLITIFCTWTYIIYTCPWLSEISSSERDKKDQ